MDIYLFAWQYHLTCELHQQKNGRKIIGRCHNQIFFIWNKSKDELFDFLNRHKSIYANYPQDMQMTVTADHKIQYLDAEISHIRGILQTRVYHHARFEPYALPYSSKIKTISPSSSSSSDLLLLLLLLRDALILAALYYSNVHEYEQEQLYIEVSFLLNHLSLYLIQKTIENFGIEFHRIKRNTLIADENAYQLFRSNIRQHYQQQSKYHLREEERQRWIRSWLYSIKGNNQR